jgi:hypothetical protein
MRIAGLERRRHEFRSGSSTAEQPASPRGRSTFSTGRHGCALFWSF